MLIFCSEERVYERDAVLGRDASSVFPTEITKQAAADRATAAESLGGRNFITESEVSLIYQLMEAPKLQLCLCAQQRRT